MKRQEQETVTNVESKQYRRAMANLPNDNKEALCGICGDRPVIINSAFKCSKCAAPLCSTCFDRVIRFEKVKWKWMHATSAKNLCFHPRHPECFTRASMKIIRDTTTRNIECEVCEHRQIKAEEREEEEEERPITQPNSPERQRLCSEGCPKSTRSSSGWLECPETCFKSTKPEPLGELTVNFTEEEEDEFEGHDWSNEDDPEKEKPSWLRQDQTRCVK